MSKLIRQVAESELFSRAGEPQLPMECMPGRKNTGKFEKLQKVSVPGSRLVKFKKIISLKPGNPEKKGYRNHAVRFKVLT
jgi:hypothetical protein